MDIRIFPDAAAVSKAAAALIAAEARAAVESRGRFTMAVSGGKTPWQMLRDLAAEQVPWDSVHVFQVDERIAPSGDPDRNLTHLRESLLSSAPISPDHIHAMPVENPDALQACEDYTATLNSLCGEPAVLDLIHLGLGPDGHTASLIPGDPVCGVFDAEVAGTGVYQNRNRLTITYPVINRARRIVWVVTGPDKAPMVPRLLAGDPGIPAGPVSQDRAVLLLDSPAAAELSN